MNEAPTALVKPRRGWRQRPSRRQPPFVRALASPGAMLVLAIILTTTFGPALWPRSAVDQSAPDRLLGPSLDHPFGTDRYGRDLLARLLEGGRWTLAGAAIVCLGITMISTLLGAVAAGRPGAVDQVISRIIEAVMGVPTLVIALGLTAVLGPSFRNVVVALVVTGWPWYARTYRGVFLQGWSASYVEGAYACGATRVHVFRQHVLPAVSGPVAVIATINLGFVVLNLTSLSFLGLGIQPPVPEWGSMISDARPYFRTHPWQMIAPGLCISVTVLAINLLGDAVRDACDPAQSTRRGQRLRRS